MKQRRWNAPRPMPAAELFADDLQDPKELIETKRPHGDRKLQQLCRQVERALCLALAGDCADSLLQELTVESVTPAPNASRLVVNVRTERKGGVEFIAQVHERLARAAGLLRREVARAITRKRAPELVFQVSLGAEVQP